MRFQITIDFETDDTKYPYQKYKTEDIQVWLIELFVNSQKVHYLDDICHIEIDKALDRKTKDAMIKSIKQDIEIIDYVWKNAKISITRR